MVFFLERCNFSHVGFHTLLPSSTRFRVVGFHTLLPSRIKAMSFSILLPVGRGLAFLKDPRKITKLLHNGTRLFFSSSLFLLGTVDVFHSSYFATMTISFRTRV